jgi:hypothetical protein
MEIILFLESFKFQVHEFLNKILLENAHEKLSDGVEKKERFHGADRWAAFLRHNNSQILSY